MTHQIQFTRTRSSIGVAVILAMLAATGGAAEPVPTSVAFNTAIMRKAYGPARWLHDYDQASLLARELGLPLIVHFHASWCQPCQEMEKETLKSNDLIRRLGKQMVGVKLDWDTHQRLVKAFGVTLIPCDIVISPDGRISERHDRYRPRSHYLAMLDRASLRFQQQRIDARAKHLRLVRPTYERELQEAAPEAIEHRRGLNYPLPQDSDTWTLPLNGTRTRHLDLGTADSAPSSTSSLIGLDGYCPVQITSKRQWIKGRPEFSTTWQGVAYRLASASNLRKFEDAPYKYAPQMLGCDSVELLTSGRAIQGRVEYGAFFMGKLYLFEGKPSRNLFKVNPDRYVGVQYSLQPGEVTGARQE